MPDYIVGVRAIAGSKPAMFFVAEHPHVGIFSSSLHSLVAIFLGRGSILGLFSLSFFLLRFFFFVFRLGQKNVVFYGIFSRNVRILH